MKRKIHIKTWGCQMNSYDSVRMGDVMESHGYEKTDNWEDADLLVLNTCHIREKAAEKVYSDLGRMRDVKEKRYNEGKEMIIAVGGCVGQAEGEEIIRRAPFVDIVMGSQSYHLLPRMVVEARAKARLIREKKLSGEKLTKEDKAGIVELEFPQVQKFDLLPETIGAQGSAAFVSIQEGCDKFCTYCVVPYTRGEEYSRSVADIEREVLELVNDKGAMEVTLLGQNVNAYAGEDERGKLLSLADLIQRLARIDGLKRIRYTTSHPNDMRDDLLQAHGEIEKLQPYLHLPIQSGSDKILKAMNRGHNAAKYIEIVEKLRSARPDIAFSGDFIVGFPGETEEDFEDTMRLVETVGYASAYSFKYSPRPGTPAADKKEQVPEDIKAERLARLQKLLNQQQKLFNQQCVGKIFDVILDREGKKKGQMIGRSPYMQAIAVPESSHLDGQLVKVRIVSATANSLIGELLQ